MHKQIASGLVLQRFRRDKTINSKIIISKFPVQKALKSINTRTWTPKRKWTIDITRINK